jgi:hypothetical protein
MRSWALAIAGLALIAGGALRFRSFSATRRPEAGYLATALTAFGISFLLNIPALARALDAHVWHVHNASTLLSHLLSILTAWGGIEMCAEITGARGRRYRAAAFGAIAVAMTAAFFAPGQQPEAADFFGP